MEIPHIIHYCWFGHNPLPPLAQKCIASWRKFLPDYEIKEWNEENFDVNAIPYTSEAYAAKKYAFVSDYARFKILYEQGGLYFDTDVEVIRPLDDIIARGPFMGCERDASGATAPAVAPGLGLGVNPGLGLYKEILDFYATQHFQKNAKGSYDTVVDYTTQILCRHGLKDIPGIQHVADVWIYPKEYFCPICIDTGKMTISNNTVCIHHYSGSWLKPSQQIYRKIRTLLGDKVARAISKTIKTCRH